MDCEECNSISEAINNEHIGCIDRLYLRGGHDIDETHITITNGMGNEIIDIDYNLNTSIRIGNIEIIEHLLKLGANVNCVDFSDRTPLHNVCLMQDPNAIDIVKLLLSKGADVNALDCNSDTPLHYAVKYCDNVIILLLLENGSDVNIKNYKGETAYDLANDSNRKIIDDFKLPIDIKEPDCE